jgi:hypothetical protein
VLQQEVCHQQAHVPHRRQNPLIAAMPPAIKLLSDFSLADRA